MAPQSRPQEGRSPQRLPREEAGVQAGLSSQRPPAGISSQLQSLEDRVQLEAGQIRPQRGVARHTNGCGRRRREEAGGGRRRQEEAGGGRRRREEAGGGGRRQEEAGGGGRRQEEAGGGGRRREEAGGGGRRRSCARPEAAPAPAADTKRVEGGIILRSPAPRSLPGLSHQ